MNHQRKYRLTVQAVMDNFYVDDGLDGADSVDEAIKLRAEMQGLTELGGFVPRKWKSSELAVLAQIPRELVESQSTLSLNIDHFIKVLGMEWSATSDTFRVVVSSLKQVEMLRKRTLLSDIARLHIKEWSLQRQSNSLCSQQL